MAYFLQLRVTAYDDADPNRVATADVTIVVQRNANAPKFEPSEYRKSVEESETLGEPIVTVTASDADKVVKSSYRTCLFIFIHIY